MNGLYLSASASQPLGHVDPVLANPTQSDGVPLFRYSTCLVVPVDNACQRISLADNASITVQFSAADILITHASQAWRLKPWSIDVNRVTVDLVLPIRVQRVTSNGYGTAAFHRMDGDTMVEDATLTTATNAAISGDFTASKFTVVLSGAKNDLIMDKMINIALQTSSSPMSSIQAPPQPIHSQKVHSQQMHSQQMKAQKASKPGNESQQVTSTTQSVLNYLYGDAVDALGVHGVPTSPRIRLLSEDSKESLWQWLEFPGEQSVNRSVTLTPEMLQPALDRALALRQPGQTGLILPLHFESDAPCQLSVTPQNVRFVREAALLPGTEPLALRFDGVSQQALTATLTGPVAAGDQLRLTLSSNLGGQSQPLQPLTPAGSLARSGFRLLAGDHLATPLPLAQAGFDSGHALAWWPLAENGRLTLSLLADQAGEPVGQVLAKAELGYSGEEPRWLVFRWDEQTLQPGRYWLQLAVEDGDGLWLAGNGNCRLHRHRVKAEKEFLDAPQTPLQVALGSAGAGENAGSGLQITLNGQGLFPQAEGDRLNVMVQQPQGGPWVLGVTASQAGVMTVKEALLRY